MTYLSTNFSGKLALSVFLIFCYFPVIISKAKLPDNYFSFQLKRMDNRFEGTSKVMKDLFVTITLPEEFKNKKVSREIFFFMVKDNQISATLFTPDGKTTPIYFEIVRHRNQDDVYMKTVTGYFLWEQSIFKKNKLSFIINWWYCPPTQPRDLEILEMTEKILSDSTKWHKTDDRKCEADIESNSWSLFCALKHSSTIIENEYNHHNTVMQTVRNIITELYPEFLIGHTLMDFNNSDKFYHKDILEILMKAKAKIKSDLDKNNNGI